MKYDVITILGKLYEYGYTDNNIHFINSFEIPKTLLQPTLTGICRKHPTLNVWKRTINSLKKEWATHNLCYKLGIARNRTKDVDLNYPLKWYMRILYSVIGTVALWIIK